MSEDQQPFPQPEDSTLKPVSGPESQGDLASPSYASTQSRRRFLRTAVISGVAVATVGTTAGVAAAATNPHPGILNRLGINLGRLSAVGSCTMCFENTEYQSISSFKVHDGHASPPEYFVWLTAHNLTPGSYSMSISPDPTNTSTPFKLASSGNNAFLFAVDTDKAKDCPTCDSKGAVTLNCPTCGPKSPVRQNHSPDGLFATAYTISGSNRDLQMQVHIKWDGTHLSSQHTYSFTGSVKDSHGTVICTATVSVTAKIGS